MNQKLKAMNQKLRATNQKLIATSQKHQRIQTKETTLHPHLTVVRMDRIHRKLTATN